ncbi:sigma-70 family RNA polymerase sigma factor [bacterium]|nr:sigma-70 family RNA polymerase sigma factor [bacterium]
MDIAADINALSIAKQRQINQTLEQQRNRLLNYIKKQVTNADDAEDILQDVFYQFAESSFLLKPIEQVSAWLYTVARNRITDLFRKRKNVAQSDLLPQTESEDEAFSDFFASIMLDDSNPENEMSRQLILDELALALDELPAKQREAFMRHELDGVNFNSMALESGETANTWISRKHYAVKHLRNRLQSIYNELLTD